MVAAKYFDDFFFKNDYYAKIGGIPKTEMNILEGEFVKSMNYNFNVSSGEFENYVEKIMAFRKVQ